MQGMQALVGHRYIYTPPPHPPSAVLHTPPLSASSAISHMLTHALGMLTASHAHIACVNAARGWLCLHASAAGESVPRDMPANPGVLMHSHTSSPASLGVPREPFGPWVQDGGDAGDASCSPKSMKEGAEGGISCFSLTPRCFCCPLQLPGWKPVHSGPRAALYLQVSAACVSSQEQEPRQLEALLELVGEGRGCLCCV